MPILGHTYGFSADRTRVMPLQQELMEKRGFGKEGVMLLYIGDQPVVSIFAPDAAQAVLSTSICCQ